MSLKKTSQHTRAAGRRERPLLTGAVIALLGLLVHLNALTNPFVYDDHRLILENLSLPRLGDWRAILYHDISRPLVNLSYAVDYVIWRGANPFGFHLTNLAIHTANVVLLYWMATSLAADRVLAGVWTEPRRETATRATALLFAVHPILTQAVGYVSARSELLCAMFLMIAFGAARRAMRGGRGWLWIAVIGSWLLALASKEIAVMFPFALFAYDYFIRPGEPEPRRRRLWTLHAPLIAVTLMAATVRLFVLINLESPAGTIVQWRFALVELDVFRRYLQLIVIPYGQTVFHAISPIQSPIAPRALLGFGTAALFLAAIWRLRKQAVISFGLSWFALLLMPSAALVVLDRGEPMAEHRLYVASAGFFLAAGSLAGMLSERFRLVSGTAVKRVRDLGFVIVAILCVQTVARNVTWHRPVSLWLEAAEYAPDHWLPRLALGEALHEEGRHEEAITMFREAVALRPTEALAYAKLGECQLELGRLEEAAVSFERLRAMDPESTAASTGLGLIALHARDSSVARRYFLETLEKEPNSVRMRQALAMVAEETDPMEALRLCQEIRQLAPQTPGNDECIRRNRQRVEAAGGTLR